MIIQRFHNSGKKHKMFSRDEAGGRRARDEEGEEEIERKAERLRERLRAHHRLAADEFIDAEERAEAAEKLARDKQALAALFATEERRRNVSKSASATGFRGDSGGNLLCQVCQTARTAPI